MSKPSNKIIKKNTNESRKIIGNCQNLSMVSYLACFTDGVVDYDFKLTLIYFVDMICHDQGGYYEE